MNDNTNDSRFNMPWNTYKDWDDAYNGTVANYSTSCGVHAAGGSCNVTVTQNSELMCLFNGNTWDAAANSGDGACLQNTINSEHFCNLRGGIWTGDSEYKFPAEKL